ncbi:MAG: nucleoside hydrolase [Bacilli bacterium]|nr:nucleoside hydrolase [Bacilli bacterium]
MEKRKLILDVDPGHDDAFAIMLAGSTEDIELLGITVVSGNQTIDKTFRNAFNVSRYLGLDVPIYMGSDKPLVKPQQACAEIHGETGLDGFNFPQYNITVPDVDAASFIVSSLHKYKDVTIVTCGPMTNLALAIKKDPTIVKNIKEVIFMGGSIGLGNITPAAEFNILCDPEAADIVINSGVCLKMIGLDITRKVLVLQGIIEKMRGIHNRASDMFVSLMEFFNKSNQALFGIPAGPLHDPVTIASIIDENLVTFKKMNVTVDCTRGPSDGRTNCDILDVLHLQKNVYVGIDINVEKFWNIVEQGLKHYE